MKKFHKKNYPTLRVSGKLGYLNLAAKEKYNLSWGDEILLKQDEYNYFIAFNSQFNERDGIRITVYEGQLRVSLAGILKDVQLLPGLYRITDEEIYDRKQGIGWYILQEIN